MENAEIRDLKTEMIAYKLWQDRGGPEGSPEDDWFRAEQELAVGERADGLRSHADS